MPQSGRGRTLTATSRPRQDIPSPVDFAHAAHPEPLRQLVGPEEGADRQRFLPIVRQWVQGSSALQDLQRRFLEEALRGPVRAEQALDLARTNSSPAQASSTKAGQCSSGWSTAAWKTSARRRQRSGVTGGKPGERIPHFGLPLPNLRVVDAAPSPDAEPAVETLTSR